MLHLLFQKWPYGLEHEIKLTALQRNKKYTISHASNHSGVARGEETMKMNLHSQNYHYANTVHDLLLMR